MDKTDLARRFRSHAIDDDGQDAMRIVREEAFRLAEAINNCVPDGREKSLAITSLEEVTFWANAGIARTGTPT